MRSFGLVRSLLGLALCKASWAWHPTDSTMDADSAATGYLPNHNMDPAVINGGGFGQLWSFTTPKSSAGLTEQFYAKPLVYTPSSTGKQVVIAFSELNRIYVLDAVTGALVTSRDMSNDPTPEPPFQVSDLGNCNDISGTIGITGTPVIDNVTDTVYFWSKSYRQQGQKGYQNGAYRFHAIDVVTLQDRPGFPTLIEGTPADNDNTRYFTGGNVLQRTSLNLINGVVYAGFGGHCDAFNYTGWVVGMRASSGTFVTAYATNGGSRAPKQDGTWNGGGGGCGIWQSGSILASDNAGRLFYATGNGYGVSVNQQSPASGKIHLDTLSETIVNMAIDPATGVVTQQDYFEPYNYAAIDSADRDLGGGGVSILPFGGSGVSRLAVTAGKNGQCYIANADNLGGYKMGAGGGDAIIQTITPPTGTAMFGNVGAYPLEGGYLYITPVGAPTYAYALGSDGSGKPAFSLSGSTADKSAGRVGTGSATITTLNGQPGTGILWVSDPDNGIRAYNAVPNGGVLTKIPLPATPVLPKFQRPAFGNGRYYTTTYTGQILGFGSPVQLPLECGGPFNFGEVPIGSSESIDITCTAKILVNKINNVTIGNPLYTASLTNVPTGVIRAGQSFTFTVSLNLTSYVLKSGSTSSPTIQPGVQSGSITLSTVNGVAGYSAAQPLSVTGTTVTTAPFAAINPVAVDFQPLVLGAAGASGGSQNTMVLQNLGKSPMTILGYAYTIGSPTAADATFTNITQDVNGTYALDSNRFFTTHDLPTIASTIAAGSSVIIHMDFLCSTLGNYYTSFAVWTDGGMAYSVLTGSANSQPLAILEHSTNEGGWVTIPPCADPSKECAFQLDLGTSTGLTQSQMIIRFTNTGGSLLMIDKSKPPIGAVLGAGNPNTDLYEGMTIAPGKSGVATMFFNPGSAALNSDAIVYSGAWTLNVNDLNFGVHILNFTGTLKGAQTGPTLPDGSARFKYLGCYKDSTNARIESTQTNLAKNTNGLCQQYAVTNKAAFAATEYTTECWVGRNIPPDSLKVDDYLCNNYICPGDSTQFCGGVGSYATMWYDTTGYFPANKSLSAAFSPPSYKKTVGNYIYSGCRTDSTASRTLAGRNVGASNVNTIESCMAACVGFTYFGTEYGTECFCGNALGSSSAVALESSCSYTCAGDPSELCGGSSRISVYALNGTTIVSSSSASASSTATTASTAIGTSTSTTTTSSAAATNTPSNVPTAGGFAFLECHSDLVAARTLTGKNTQSGTLTVEVCAAYCDGYTYFGLEYSQECFCGNTLLASSTAATDGRCNMVCSGNPLQLCGGPDGLSLYKKVSSSSSSSSSSSAAAGSSSSTGSVSSTATTAATSTISTSTISTSSAATPSVTVTCPSEDGQIYTAVNGKTFQLECYIDHAQGDLALTYVSSYALCAEACSTTATCQAFAWVPGVESPCYMKSSIGAPNANSGVWGAKLVALPASSSTSSTSSTASSSASSSSVVTSTVSSTSSTVSSSSSASSTSSSSSSAVSSTTSSSATSTTSVASTSSTVSSSSSTSLATTTTASSSSTASLSSSASSSTSSVASTSSTTSTSSSSVSSSTSTSSIVSSSSSSSVVPTTTSVSSSSSTSVSSSTTSSSVSSTSTTAPASTSSSSSSSPSVSSTTSSTLSVVSTTSSSSTSSSSTSSSSSSSTSSSSTSSSSTSSSSSSSSSTVASTSSTTSSTSSAAPSTSSSSSSSSSSVSTSTVSSTSSTTSSTSSVAATTSTSTVGTTSTTSINTSAAPSPTTYEPWSLLGCANDTTALRALNGSTTTSTSLTIESCQSFCTSKNYPLAGVEYGTQCYCGLDLSPGGFTYGQTGCSMACGGNSAQTCGGKSRLNVYRNNTYVMPRVVQELAVTETKIKTLQGCFVDSAGARLLNKLVWTPGTGVSVETCVAKCQSKGFEVSGVEYGGECYCGSVVPGASSLAANEYDCRATFCNGDLTEFCGGGKRMLVYA
ncbi:WSC domain-containing protein [Bombardia bombarda]|uniref:WSC domain-containing protein n=1 Tax=Bombardia bombarda TaxID=252184 RepID=A0AA39XLI1_9PEZI|nr:WSC domain-containing protein [Bombardia bombarda]